MTNTEKLRRTFLHALSSPGLSSELQKALQELINPTHLSIAAGVLAMWAASHLFGVGEAVDFALVGIAYFTLGAQAVRGVAELVEFGIEVAGAQTDLELRRAATKLVRAFMLLGVEAALALLTKRAHLKALERKSTPPRASQQPAPQAHAGAHAGKPAEKAVDTAQTAKTLNYRETFFAAHPELRGKVVVHHAVEQQVRAKYPGMFTEAELHSMSNLRGIPNDINSDLHLSKIRVAWNQFYRTHPAATTTKQQVLDFAKELDKRFGALFNPPR
jgi:hypothetical protein